MEPPRDQRAPKDQYVVLNRAHAGLYEEMVSLFSAWPNIVVIVDRRRTPRHEPLGFPYVSSGSFGVVDAANLRRDAQWAT